MPNPQERYFTTVEVGRLTGYSTQQIRDLERLGALPQAERGANGYRRYRPIHVAAAHAYRALALAIGPVPTRRLMPRLLTATVDDAAERIDALHAALDSERARVRSARRGLDAVLSEPPTEFDESDVMTIGELAQALGVRPSALRHWEQMDLVRPGRDHSTGARHYGDRSIAEARIVASLREGGYPVPRIHEVLAHLRARGLTAHVRALLDERLAGLTARSVALLAAASHLHALLTTRSA
ncbi:MerR family transcriptional regulator [Microbacterium sp. NPDC056234]|uniref:MerR family transcriptional regulator n=1 Tax=Microbacterium sp. NPDC056234 TaxID=3345757 RepID=UPI0035DE5C75